MAAIILRLYELLFTQTVVLEEFISLTDCTVNNNFLQNSSFSYLFKNNNEEIKKLESNIEKLAMPDAAEVIAKEVLKLVK